MLVVRRFAVVTVVAFLTLVSACGGGSGAGAGRPAAPATSAPGLPVVNRARVVAGGQETRDQQLQQQIDQMAP
jgi:hypothetical protein